MKWFLFSLILSVPTLAHAQTHTLVSDSLGLRGDNLGGYFNNLFELALLVGAVLAVLIIASAGLQYMSTDAVSGKTTSRERIVQAVLGLLMLLAVWLFFKEINPQILQIDFALDKAATTGAGLEIPEPVAPVRETAAQREARLKRESLERVATTTGPTWETPGGPKASFYTKAIAKEPRCGSPTPPSACGTPDAGYKYGRLGTGIDCPGIDLFCHACCVFTLIEE